MPYRLMHLLAPAMSLYTNSPDFPRLFFIALEIVSGLQQEAPGCIYVLEVGSGKSLRR
jgi:hypothetical protein